MKLINKRTDYAVRALVYLSRNGGRYVPSREISEREGMPDKFLKRLLQVLLKKGFVVSREGKGGGVMLAKKPRDISVLDVMVLFQGDFQISECMFRKNTCPNRKTCVLRAKVKTVEKGIESQFGQMSIESLGK